MTCRDAIPTSWTDFLRAGPLGIGLDLATTDGPHSNPSALVVMEDYAGQLWERLVIAWKTSNEEVTEAMFGLVLDDIRSSGRRPKAACIDASNETFFAQGLRKQFGTRCPIYLIKGGENLTHAGETMAAKQLLGSLYVNEHTDGRINTPAAPWVKDDRRLVKKQKGLFMTDTDKLGQHGDTFDAGKLARWALKRAGRVEAGGASVGGPPSTPRDRVPRPFGHLFQAIKRVLHHA